MHVILRLRRKIEIHDMRDPLDVDAARGDVRGDENAHRSALEGFECGQPLVLTPIGVKGGRADPRLRELAGDLVGAMLRP